MLLITKVISTAVGSVMSLSTLPAVGILIVIEALTTDKKLSDIVAEVRSGIKDVYNESRGVIIRLEENTMRLFHKMEKASPAASISPADNSM